MHIRSHAGLKQGSGFIFTNNKSEISAFAVNGNTLRIKILVKTDATIPKILDIFSDFRVDTIASIMKSNRNGIEWYAVIDITGCKNFGKFEKKLQNLSYIKNLEVGQV